MQTITIDLSSATILLSMALGELLYLRESLKSILSATDILATGWNITPGIRTKRFKPNKKFLGELTIDERLHNPESKFRLNVFNAIIDTALKQLEIRFKRQKMVTDIFSFLNPSKMIKSSNSELEDAVYQLLEVYNTDLSSNLLSELRSFRHEFQKEIDNDSKSVLDILKLPISSEIISSMPELVTPCALFLVLPVTVSSAERSFCKLKL